MFRNWLQSTQHIGELNVILFLASSGAINENDWLNDWHQSCDDMVK